jgi:small subunit ribosomal protein S11
MGRTRTKIVSGEEQSKNKETKEKSKKSKKKYIDLGIFYITSELNNTIISFTDSRGNVLKWSSCGHAGFKNTKKSTPYASAKAAEILVEKVKSNFDIGEAKVIVKGIGPGRESALRVIFNNDFNIVSVEDKTPIPFGGPTPPKPRRV